MGIDTDTIDYVGPEREGEREKLIAYGIYIESKAEREYVREGGDREAERERKREKREG